MPAKAERSIERNTSSTNLRLHSPAVSVKRESIETPEPMPRGKPVLGDDEATQATIDALTNERGLRSTRKSSEPKTKPSPAATSPPGPPKRRGGKNIAMVKKAPSKRALASKKRKVKPDTSVDNSPTTSRNASASKKRNSKGGTPTSPQTADAEDIASGDESPAGSDAEDEIYCICRRPDDHKYMIGCDGGCDNWFHGACVNITETKGKLIDKYICEKCGANGKGCTTWKPMCRRDGCVAPARVGNLATAGAGPSKYCSDECGQRVFAERLRSAAAEKPRASRKRRSAAAAASDSDSEGDGGARVAPISRTGPLRAGALTALARAAAGGASFRALGGVGDSFSPPSAAAAAPEPALTRGERAALADVAAKKEALRAARAALAERTRFLERARAAATAAAEKAGGKVKEFCGFDARLAWSAAKWGAGKENEEPTNGAAANGTAAGDDDDDVAMADGDGPAAADDDDGLVCARRRCERHKQWPRLMLDDLRFEEAMQADRMRELDRAEREIHDVASRRWREEVSGVGERLGFVVVAGDEMEG
jgi:COMPASS component SPP1